MTARILIVDDELAIRRLVRGAVERAGFDVDEAATASEGHTAARREGCELVLLDLGLPDRDGIELVPLLKALDLGADDYMVKPFDTDELIARVRVALRHRAGGNNSDGVLKIGELSIDLAKRRVQRSGADVSLTRKEYAVLAELARHPDRVLTHTHLLRTVWGEAHLDDVEYLRVAMRGLRTKLEANPSSPMVLLNEPGIGYRLVAS